MDYKVEWSPKSVSDFGEHVSLQRRVSIEAISSLSSNVIEAALSLTSFPERFPEFPMPKNFPVTIHNTL